MAKIISFEKYRQKRDAEKEMKERRESINRIIGHAKDHCNWKDNDDPNNSK